MKYGTFWQRFAAMWIDFFVLLPLTFMYEWMSAYSKLVAIILLAPCCFMFVAYHIYCHGKFGQTVGKKVMEIRVVKPSGERIGWREAWLRSSVDLGFAAFSLGGMFYALLIIPDAQYYVSWIERNENLTSFNFLSTGWVYAAMNLWVWSEVIVMLFNEKRRALHDFIAGTVVLSERAVAAPPVLTAPTSPGL